MEDIASGDVDDAVNRLKDWRRIAQLWGGPRVVRSFFAVSNQSGKSETLGDFAETVEPIGALFLSMRRDLGLSNFRIVPRKFGDSVSKAMILGVYWQLRHPELFLTHLRATPEMTMDQYQLIESKANEKAGIV